MEVIKHEIFDQNEALCRTRAQLLSQKAELQAALRGDYASILFLGCGSSYMLSCSGAAMFSLHTEKKAVAIAAGEILLDPDKYTRLFENALVVVTSRSGETSEVVYALQLMQQRAKFATVGLLAKDPCTMKPMMDVAVMIPWAFDESVCQTRNISNFYYALSMFFAFYAGDDKLEADFSAYIDAQNAYLKAIEPDCHAVAARGWKNVTVLADGEVSGVASEAALAFTEICMLPGEFFHVLDYRHGPIVVADPAKLVIVLLTGKEETQQKKMVADLCAHGSYVITLGRGCKADWGSNLHITLDGTLRDEVFGLPLVNLCQVLAFHKALAVGHDPDVPAGLDPFIKL